MSMNAPSDDLVARVYRAVCSGKAQMSLSSFGGEAAARAVLKQADPIQLAKAQSPVEVEIALNTVPGAANMKIRGENARENALRKLERTENEAAEVTLQEGRNRALTGGR